MKICIRCSGKFDPAYAAGYGIAVEKIRVCESCFAKAITALIHETEKENPDDQ